MDPSVTIAAAVPADAEAIAAIYAHHVEHGNASYEIAPPTAEEMAARMARAEAAGWPWLAARALRQAQDGPESEVVGYAYVTQFRDRSAYRYVCENSIYIRDDRRGEGLGRALLALLIVAAERAGFRQMIAVIGGAEPASERLHAACGFVTAGRLTGIGRKHAQWLDTLYMQRALGQGDATPPEVEPE
ncbi:MAG: GNAT family N-acetyltransferase [Novosphingobium sp.]